MLLVAKVVKKNEPTKRWPYFFLVSNLPPFVEEIGLFAETIATALNYLGQSDVKEVYFDRYILIHNY